MIARRYFIAGTDTGVGKTTVACGLLQNAAQMGWKTLACKPVAAGCNVTEDGLRNSDALALMSAMSEELPYSQVNPVALAEPIAPHIAALREKRTLSVSRLAGFCNGLLTHSADMLLVEGAGGWRVPLNPRETLADLAKALNLPVILVVGMRLGCINHALLTAEAVRRDELVLAGWVANSLQDGMPCFEENLQALQTLIPAPCLGVVPHLPAADATRVAGFLRLQALIDSPE